MKRNKIDIELEKTRNKVVNIPLTKIEDKRDSEMVYYYLKHLGKTIKTNDETINLKSETLDFLELKSDELNKKISKLEEEISKLTNCVNLPPIKSKTKIDIN